MNVIIAWVYRKCCDFTSRRCGENSGTARKTRKKRKLVIDEQKLIPSDTMRAQLRRAADLVVPLELAPPTKRLMEWKDKGGVDRLFNTPGKQIMPARLRQVSFTRLDYYRPHLTYLCLCSTPDACFYAYFCKVFLLSFGFYDSIILLVS